MLYLEKTRILASNNVPVASAATIADEGQALVVDTTAAELAVKPATGAAGEKFYGLAIFERRIPSKLPAVVSYTSAGVQDTSNVLANFVAGSFKAFVNGVAEADTTKVDVAANGTVDLKATLNNGDVVTIQYSYVPTVIEAETMVGSVFSRSVLDEGAEVGALTKGTAFVSNFDTAVEWTLGDSIKLAAGGVLTNAGAGGDVTGAIVVHVPTAAEPMLGVELR